MAESEIDLLTELYLRCNFVVRETVKADTGRYPRDYKQLELAKLNRYFTTISYKSTTNLDFTSEVMSNLIVLHGLPNTNHRSTILFTALIFEVQGIRFPYYGSKAYKRQWIDDCNKYITRSKRILYSRKVDTEYKQKHLKWTKEWLIQVVGNQSNNSGMMSRKALTTLKNISSSLSSHSVIVNE